MNIYHWILVTGFLICFISCLYFFFKVILAGIPVDYSVPLGKPLSGVIYSYTGSMSPKKKESAYLYLPTYTAGMLFHLGTFFAFVWLTVFFFTGIHRIEIVVLSSVILFITGSLGLSLFIKRIVSPTMRKLSQPDDFLSNILVTGFHYISAITLLNQSLLPVLFVYASLLFLYIPVGKLRHTVFFFTTRFYLGYFYGWRGVWPNKNNK